MNWAALEGIGTVAGAFVVLVALIQLREMKRARRAQLALPLFQEMRAIDCHRALKHIYCTVDRSNPTPTIDDYTRRQIGVIVDRLELIGVLVAKGLVENDFAMKVTRTSALRFWYVVGKYLKQLREKRGHYAIFVEDYARRCLLYEMENVRKDLRAKIKVGDKYNAIIVDEMKEFLDKEDNEFGLCKYELYFTRRTGAKHLLQRFTFCPK